MALDKNKLGYVTFEETKKVLNETGLNDFNEKLLLLTKSEIFNRIDYYNLLILFNSNNKINIINYVELKKKIILIKIMKI